MNTRLIFEDDSETSSVHDSGSSYDPDRHITLRGKWCMDGARNLDECIDMLQRFITYIEELKRDGYELSEPVADDFGFVEKS